MLTAVNTSDTFRCITDLPSVDSLFSRIRASREERDISNARNLHLQICQYGLDFNDIVGNHIVPMYVDCGSLFEAQRVFKQLDHHTEHSWTSLIQGFYEGESGEYGLGLYHEMLHEGVNPSPRTFVVLLRTCVKLRSVERGQEFHSEITKKGFEKNIFVANLLVDMYAKYGLVLDFEDTFNNLPFRDSFSWTALAVGYMELGFSEEALTCLARMQAEGIPFNTVSYLCNLKGCGILGDLNKGYLVHADIAVNGFESMNFVGSALVGMYVKLGLLAQAQDVFDEMLNRDAVLWNTLFMGYAEHGYDEVALKCWEQMNAEGVSPDAAAYVSVIRTCTTIGAIERGQEIHTACLYKGFESDPYLISSFIDMYMKFGYFIEAEAVCKQRDNLDAVLWTGLIAGYAGHGLSKQAMDCFKHMCCDGILPNAITFSCALKACYSGRYKNEGQEIHIEAVKVGLEGDFLVSGSLMDFYARFGLFAEAELLFDRRPLQDLVSWNILIAGYVEHGVCEEALKCFKQMQEEHIPGTVLTFISSLKACGGMADVEAGHLVHISIIKQGLETDTHVGNVLVDMYVKCCSLEEAEDGFKRLDSRDVISWTAMIQGYADKQLGFKAINYFELMQEENIFPDVITFSCVLQACTSVEATERGRLIHMGMVTRGLDVDPLAENALLNMYVKLGLLDEAWAVFDMVLAPDVGMWNKLIQVHSEHGLPSEAMSFLQHMQFEGLFPDVFTWHAVMVGYVENDDGEKVFEIYAQMQEQGMTPDDYIFVSVLAACGNMAALQYGRRFHSQIVRTNSWLASEVNIAVNLMDMYGKCGSMADAQQVFDLMPERNIIALNALITGYTRQGNSKLVFSLYKSIMKEGFAPNEITCLSLMSACQHAGLVETGLECFESMSQELGIEPAMKHYAYTFDLLGRAGRLSEIVTLMQEMPFQPNFVTWHTFICACQRCGNVGLVRQAFEFATSLDEKHVGAYIFVSNMYADVDLEELKELFLSRQAPDF